MHDDIDLPVHPTLLHPRTGQPLQALGIVAGEPVWPILGGDGSEDDANDDGDDLEDDSDDSEEDEDGTDDGDDSDDEEDEDNKPLGDKGQKALDRMKVERKELRKTIRELRAEIAELRNGDDDDKDELETARSETKAERDKRIEAEKRLAAKNAGLPESWASRLQGDDYEDFLEDAESLAEDLPNPRDRKGGGGAKDGQRKRRKPSLDDRIAEAEKNGDRALARKLKAQKVHELHAAQ